jgi:hypothetical protein
MEAAVLPFLDAPPPAMPAPADLPEARRAVLQALVHATEKAREEWGAVAVRT